ncbi:MAG: CoA transferase, partial [Actinobacteria bacterium]|nr:CoA transferase [Actinomycetota bacterium]
STLDALGGSMSVTGYDVDTPLWSSNKVNYPDQTASLLGPGLIVMAVLAARHAKKSLWIDISQREIVTSMLGEEILRTSITGVDPIPRANNGPAGYEWATPCAGDDDWLAVSVFGQQDRQALASVAGKPELATATDEALRAGVADWSVQHSKHEAMKLLQAARVAAAVISKGPELHNDAYYKAIDYFRPVDLPTGGGQELQRGWVVRFDDEAAAAIQHRAPHVGENTVAVLQELLELPNEEIDRLLSVGAVYQPES